MNDKIALGLLKLKRIKNKTLFNHNSDILKRKSNNAGVLSSSVKHSQMLEENKAQMLLSENGLLKDNLENNCNIKIGHAQQIKNFLEKRNTLKYIANLDNPYPLLNKVSNRGSINRSKNFIKDVIDNYDVFSFVSKEFNREIIEIDEKEAIKERLGWSLRNIPDLEKLQNLEQEKKLKIINLLNKKNSKGVEPIEEIDPKEFHYKSLNAKNVLKENTRLIKYLSNFKLAESIINTPKRTLQPTIQNKGSTMITQISIEEEFKATPKYKKKFLNKNNRYHSTCISFDLTSPIDHIDKSSKKYTSENISKSNASKSKFILKKNSSNLQNKIKENILTKKDSEKFNVNHIEDSNYDDYNNYFAKVNNESRCQLSNRKIRKFKNESLFKINFTHNGSKGSKDTEFMKTINDHLNQLNKKEHLSRKLKKSKIDVTIFTNSLLSTKESFIHTKSQSNTKINKNICPNIFESIKTKYSVK